MTSDPALYLDLFEEIRKLHNQLRWMGDQIHGEQGQSSARRSLLFSLYRDGPLTVPELAAERLVSRQIIQTQMNSLLDEGLVVSRRNPRHKRSHQLALSRKGRALVERMRERELELLEQLNGLLSPSELSQTIDSLSRFCDYLNSNPPVEAI